ncbi:MAG: hypothetical protein CO187_02440 [Zetaproteobacteria bacterium CG_4_9_14_3_um_filter_53_7]|nr:MAG: hypothetical protein CO187_02440 [Zetaproteobacteria bacterium CG_4_9_14_3_um_filter_53_7]
MPKLFWDTDEGRGTGPAYAKGGAVDSAGDNPRAPLEVPPELRAELEMPEAGQTSSNAAQVPVQYRQAVAGKAVALDARLYDVQPNQLLSAVVDAMTSLNLPVGSVDSPSGIVTSDWVRKGSSNDGLMGLGNIFGASSSVYRYRFIVRVFNADAGNSRLEVRTLTQSYQNSHWVNKPANIKLSADLFDAVEKQLGLMPAQPQPVVDAVAE